MKKASKRDKKRLIVGIAAIAEDNSTSSLEARAKLADRAEKYFHERISRGLHPDQAIKESLRIAAGGNHAKYLLAIKVVREFG
jgi:hypothetical protein